MITIKTLKSKLYTSFDAITSFEIIWANQNSPRPSTNYITLLIGSFIRIGRDEIGEPDDEETPGEIGGATIIKGNREFTLSIQAFGEGSYQELINIQSKLEMPSIRTEFAEGNGVALIRSDNVNDLTGLMEADYEERANLDVICRIVSPFDTVAEALATEDEGVIEGINLNEEIEDMMNVKTIDLNQVPADYDLFEGTVEPVILEALIVALPDDAASIAALTSISVQTDHTTPQEFISTVQAAIANMTARAQFAWNGNVLLEVGDKIQLTINGGAEGAEYLVKVYVKYQSLDENGVLEAS